MFEWQTPPDWFDPGIEGHLAVSPQRLWDVCYPVWLNETPRILGEWQMNRSGSLWGLLQNIIYTLEDVSNAVGTLPFSSSYWTSMWMTLPALADHWDRSWGSLNGMLAAMNAAIHPKTYDWSQWVSDLFDDDLPL